MITRVGGDREHVLGLGLGLLQAIKAANFSEYKHPNLPDTEYYQHNGLYQSLMKRNFIPLNLTVIDHHVIIV
jgi:hypothetical protein